MDTAYLKFGDYIYLYSEEQEGYLSAFGFFEPDLSCMRLSPEEKEVTPHHHALVFSMVPRLMYEAHDEFDENEENLARLKQIEMQAASKDAEAPAEDEKKALNNSEEQRLLLKKQQLLRRRKKQERDNNARLVEQRNGDYILFGYEVQLMHINTG